MLKKYKKIGKCFAYLFSLCIFAVFPGCGRRGAEPQSALLQPSSGLSVRNVYQVKTIELADSFSQLSEQNIYLSGKECFVLADEKIYVRPLDDASSVPRELSLPLEETGYITEFFPEAQCCDCIVIDGGNRCFRKYDWNGEMLAEKTLPQEVLRSMERSVSHLAADGSGTLLIGCDDRLFLLDDQCRLQGQIKLPGSLTDLCIAKDGSAYLSYQNESYQTFLAEINTHKRELADAREIPGNGRLFPGIERGVLFYDTLYLYEYDPGTQKTEAFLEWGENYIAVADFLGIAGDTEAQLYILTGLSRESGTSSESLQLHLLSRITRKEKEALDMEKQAVKLLTISNYDPELQAAVIDFNRQNRDYRVVLENINYQDIADTLLFINTRLLGEDAPDMLLNPPRDFEHYIQAGLAADLSPCLADSPNLSQDDFLEEALRPYSKNGKLYALPKWFSIRTLAGRTELIKGFRGSLDTGDGCSIREFADYLTQNPDIKLQIHGGPGLLVTQLCMWHGQTAYVDFENGSCHFAGEAFRELLLTMEPLQIETNFSDEQWMEMIAGKEKLIDDIYLNNFMDIARLETQYGGDLEFMGFPTADGSLKTTIEPGGVFTVMEKSSRKEGAWAFIEFFMQREPGPGTSGFPTEKHQLARLEKQIQLRQYQLDADGERIEVPLSYLLINDEAVPVYSVDSEQVQKTMELIRCGEAIRPETDTINSILYEELFYYLNGDKTLDEVLNVVQSRVNLFLQERM